MDTEFYEHLPEFFPHTDARSWFAGNDTLAETTAFRNSSLQGAYFLLAARALGLDTGPMSGFDNAAVDRAFFADQPKVKSNFISTLGYGDPASIFERSPRPDRSEEHTSELQSLMRSSYAVLCLKKKKTRQSSDHLNN